MKKLSFMALCCLSIFGMQHNAVSTQTHRSYICLLPKDIRLLFFNSFFKKWPTYSTAKILVPFLHLEHDSNVHEYILSHNKINNVEFNILVATPCSRNWLTTKGINELNHLSIEKKLHYYFLPLAIAHRIILLRIF